MNVHNRRILVTGAVGFIGAQLVAELLQRGARVTVLHHHNALPDELVSRVEIKQGDVRDTASLVDACTEQEVIFHLAAYIPQNMNDARTARDCFEINALGTLHVAECASECGAQLIHFSTGNLYMPSETPVSEDAPTYPAARAPYYLASKLAGEIFVEHFRRTRNLNATVLRVASVYGWGAPRSVVSHWMQNAARGKLLRVLDGGVPRYDFVHIADIVNAALAVMEKNVNGIFNLGSGTSHSLLELARFIIALFPDKRVEVELVPPVGEVAPNFSPLNCARANAAWGYAPRTLSQGLHEMRRAMDGAAY